MCLVLSERYRILRPLRVFKGVYFFYKMRCLHVLSLALASVLALVLGRFRADVPDPLPLAQDIELVLGGPDTPLELKESIHSHEEPPLSMKR